ncbi:YcnI family copper-binding membrane protein [Arthrobacter sp. Leaf69]|uniref:YcnI family copper-binding membrane protein n=1 Tax=Arthrobacter sp. Leaf69 TaxID=1736232 RepID=UPI0006F982CA|nr:YcnI family protein [Arthrobacter sp. Leaf69]KQN88997.1 nuclear export factor GLE1 [Arthrobacter sp. Leaf69]
MKTSSIPVLRRTLTATAVAGGTAALMLAGISGASAHVGVTPDKTTANSYALLTFGIPHGCEESGTTKVTITLPAELNDAQPTVNPNWTAQKVTEQLAAPKKLADGTSITKRTSKIVYTAKAPLEPALRDALVLSVKLPDVAGKILYFPTLQNCEVGQTDWSQLPAEGQDPHSLKAPAPSVTVTAADTEADGHGAHAASASDSTPETVQAAAVSNDGAEARSWAGLVAGVGGLALGGLALARSRSNKPVPVRAPAPGSAPKE